MKRVIMLLLVIALCASSAWADRTHVVKEGEYLSRIARDYGVRWQEIQKANGLKKTIIRAGQKLVIPEPSQKASALKKTWKKIVYHVQNGIRYIMGSPFWSKPNGNPFRAKLEDGLKVLGFKAENRKGLLREVDAKRFVDGIAYHKDYESSDKRAGLVVDKNGNRYLPVEMLSGGSSPTNPIELKTGPNGVIHSWSDVNHLEGGNIYVSGGEYLIIYRTCKNPTRLILISPPPPPPAVVEAPPEPPPLPPIFQKVSVEKACVSCEHELDAGAGKWWNEDFTADGWWWFAQYKNFLSNCGRFQKDAFGGTITPIVGIFARGDLGDNDWGYEWNNWGIGPQVGAMWNGITDEGYPQQVQLLARLLYEDMHGKNSSSGYHKDEEHILLGLYGEHLRRFAPDKMNVFYAEAWFDLNESFDSTWSGDSASDRTGFAAGYKFHKDWNVNWASRFGVQIGLLPQDDQWGANANIEMRYKDWLIFGPSFDYVIASDIAGVAGGWAFGPFVRVELHHQVQKKWTETRMEQVQPAGQELLKY